jgi:2-keto-3-deoxy-L-rhamnonate aldolase RhmA
MRANPVKAKLARGEYSFGAMIFEFFAPGIAQIVKNAGAEFVLYDMEHAGTGIDEMKRQFSYCRGLDIVPMVRVPTAQYHFIARLLDAGAFGIMVPMVETKEQAQLIASSAYYPPIGYRGAGFGMAHDDYSGGNVKDKIAALQERTFVICQIETAKGLENVEAIAQVPGIDCLWLGHFDLTNFMGIPGQFDHPSYLAAVKKIVETAHKHKKAAGFMASDEKWAKEYLGHGFDIICAGVDSAIFQNAVANLLGGMRALAGKGR